VYDPCAARHDEAGRAAVRSLAAALGFELREDLPLNGEHAACCGFGGHIYPANPGLLGAVIGERRSETPMITYCANCRDLFLSKGYEATHILEHMFGSEAQGRLPGLSERRDNRRAVKDRFCGSRVKPGMTEAAPGMTAISPWLEAKMDRLLLLREDVYEAICYCEESGRKLTDPDTGQLIGSHAGRVTTVWVEYSIAEDSEAAAKKAGATATLHNVYTHRMRIREQIAGESYHGQNSGSKAGVIAGQESETRLICAKCREPLLLLETKFSYLGHDFTHPVLRCPSCGIAYIPEELAAGKIAEVEAMLEDK
jgi:hypothetical protein